MRLRLSSRHLLVQLRLRRIEIDLLVVLVLDRHLVDQRLEFSHRQIPATHSPTTVQSWLKVGRYVTVCHTGASLVCSKPYQSPLIFREIPWQGQGQLPSFYRISSSDYLKTCATAPSRGAYSECIRNHLSAAGSVRTRYESSQRCPTLPMGGESRDMEGTQRQGTERHGGNGKRDGGGKEKERRNKIPYWYLFFPLPALLWTYQTSVSANITCIQHSFARFFNIARWGILQQFR